MARDPLAPHEIILDTAMQPDDDDPMMTDDGETEMTPEFDEHHMLETLQAPPIGDPQAQLEPQEAYDQMKFSAPVSPEELQILRETPFLGPELSFVDDADHDEWITNRMRDKRRAFDGVLEDTVYGEDDDLGFGLSSLTHAVSRAAHGVSRAARGVEHGVVSSARKIAGVVRKFVPSRDAGKARLVKQTNARLVQGRANFLQMADIKRGVKGKPRSYYLAKARPWARSRLASAGLPTTFTSGEVAATILGEEDMMGSWWNPFSWFQQKVKYVVQNAQGQIAEMSESDFNNWVAQQQQAQGQPADSSATPTDQSQQMDQSMQQPPMDQSMDPSMMQQPPMDQSMMQQPPMDQSMDPSMAAPDDGSMGLLGEDRWERDLEIHQLLEKAARGDKGAVAALQQLKKKAAGGDVAAAADMNEVSNYQKETGMHVMGEDEEIILGSGPNYELMVGDEAGAFSDFAGDVLPIRRRRKISAAKYRAMTMRSAQNATGSPNPPAAAIFAAHKRLARKLAAKKIGVVDQSGNDMMGAWLYKLSPLYWMKSSRERKLIDAEKQNWQKTQDLAKQSSSTEKALSQAKRAQYQHEQAKAAEQHSQELEAELEDTEKSLTSGAFVGAFVGDNVGPAIEAAAAGKNAARANAARAGSLAAKLEAGEKLTPEELGKLRGCLKMCHHLRKLHDQLHGKNGAAEAVTTSGYHDYKQAPNDQASFLGEMPAEILGEEEPGTLTEILGEPVQEILGATAPALPPKQHLIAMTALAATSPGKATAYAKQHGIRLTPALSSQIRAAAIRARAIMKHPSYGRATMRGDLMGDDAMGFSWTKLLTAPLAAAALPAAALAWGATKVINAPAQLLKWGAKKGGWYGGTSSSQQQPGSQYSSPQAQQASIQAARQRQLAAQKRIAAANAASAAAQQQYQAEAAAADAEAQAQQAEADAQQAQMDAQSAQYMPGQADDGTQDDGTDQSGSVTVLGADFFSGAFVGEVDDPKAKKIIEEAQKNTPTGKKIRAGATLYAKAKRGDKKSRLAIAKIRAKANAGDPQAQRDYNAVKAGKIALRAKGRAHLKIAIKRRREAADRKGIAVRKHLEARAGKRLGEHTRRRKLAKVAKVERAAAAGHPKAKKAIAHVVAKAHAGDPKAKTTVAALQLARHVRTSAKTPAERRRLHAAHKVVYKARHGNKKAIRTIALIDAAAKQGQPNARRAKARLAVAARVERAVATGKISPPTSKEKKHAAARKHVLYVKNRIDTGIATKEEAISAARAAKSVGDHKTAGELALHAHALPSAKAPIKDAAAVAAAAEQGSPQAKAIIDKTLEDAQSGDPKAINGAGKLAAAQAVAAVNKGKPMPAPIAEATLIVERAQAGDEEAKRTVQRAGAAAQDPDHPDHAKAVESAVALTAASAILAATAGSAAASHWKKEARKTTGTHVDSADQGKAEQELSELLVKLHDGSATWTEGVRARDLAMALNRPKVAAEISAIMPPRDTLDTPMSSLPDLPEPPIRGPMGLVREALKALVFATSDPFGNYREGVRSRGQS